MEAISSVDPRIILDLAKFLKRLKPLKPNHKINGVNELLDILEQHSLMYINLTMLHKLLYHRGDISFDADFCATHIISYGPSYIFIVISLYLCIRNHVHCCAFNS